MRSFDVDIRDSGRVRRRGEGKRQRRGRERVCGFRDTDVLFVCRIVGCRSFFRVQKLAGTSRISLIDLCRLSLCKTICMH